MPTATGKPTTLAITSMKLAHPSHTTLTDSETT
jgi:hypothetical protein